MKIKRQACKARFVIGQKIVQLISRFTILVVYEYKSAFSSIGIVIPSIGKYIQRNLFYSGSNEMIVRYEFKNFPNINVNAVKEIGIVAKTDFTTGSFQVVIKNIRFVR